MSKALTEEQIQANQARYIELINSIEREGFKKESLIAKLQSRQKAGDMNFFESPASVKYHMDCKGGLCAHSLNVYDILTTLVKTFGLEEQFSSDSLKIVALLHDISKTNMYEVTTKNKKYYYEGGTKKDESGSFDWVTEMGYKVKEYEDRFLYGTHAETSVFMIKFFVNLTLPEEIAILHHMAGMDQMLTYNERSDQSAVFTRFPLATLLYVADYLSTFMAENDNCEGIFLKNGIFGIEPPKEEEVPDPAEESEVFTEITNE